MLIKVKLKFRVFFKWSLAKKVFFSDLVIHLFSMTFFYLDILKVTIPEKSLIQEGGCLRHIVNGIIQPICGNLSS